MAREIAAGDLPLSHGTVYTLFAQAIQQVGVVSRLGKFDWHTELSQKPFAEALITQLRQVHASVADNWQEVSTLKLITLTLIRLLSASPTQPIVSDARALLSSVRQTLYTWLKDLVASFADCADAHVEYLKARIRDIAAACRMSYDVDLSHGRDIMRQPNAVEIFVYCGISIYDNRTSGLDTTKDVSRITVDRDERVAVKLEKQLWQAIQGDSKGLDAAVQAVWPTFKRRLSWSRMDAPNERWMSCQTRGGRGSRSQHVQLNILEGRLLIDGKPLGRLPVEITNHAVYQRLFGKVRKSTPSSCSC